MRFSCIIATKARPESLRGALDSARATLPVDSELIVVDGDPSRSAQDVVSELVARRPPFAVSYLPSDPGLPRQRNVGMDAARGDILVFCDDDCTLTEGLLDALATAYEDPMVVGATGLVVEPPLARIGSGTHSRLRRSVLGGGREGSMTSFGFRRPIIDLHSPRDVEFMPGPLMSARREVAAEVRFDERLTGYGLGEDDDFSYRLSQRGRIRYVPEAVVQHHEIGWRRMDRRERDRRQVVNRVYLFNKNFAPTLRARTGLAVLLMMMFAHRILNREWDGLRGLAEGVWHVARRGADALDAPASRTRTGDAAMIAARNDRG